MYNTYFNNGKFIYVCTLRSKVPIGTTMVFHNTLSLQPPVSICYCWHGFTKSCL